MNYACLLDMESVCNLEPESLVLCAIRQTLRVLFGRGMSVSAGLPLVDKPKHHVYAGLKHQE
jgi:hypothetical protein